MRDVMEARPITQVDVFGLFTASHMHGECVRS